MDVDTSKIGLFFCAVAVFIGIGIFAVSWGSVEPTQWGLKYNTFTKQIDNTTIYDGGRYLIGPFDSFILFPRTQQTIKLSNDSDADAAPLSTRTNEGLSLQLSVSFQYKLIQQDIPKLYFLASTNYESTFLRISRQTLLAIAGSYGASDYWTNRIAIGQDMLATLNTQLQTAYATCENLEITTIDLPQSYEDSIVTTQVAIQGATTKQYSQQAALVRKQIDVLTSQAQQNVTITNATANAQAYTIVQQAEATAASNSINAEDATYGTIQQKLGFNSSDLDNYIFYTSLQSKDSKLFVGFGNNVFFNNMS